jgi:hypothetical protein
VTLISTKDNKVNNEYGAYTVAGDVRWHVIASSIVSRIQSPNSAVARANTLFHIDIHHSIVSRYSIDCYCRCWRRHNDNKDTI